MKNLNMCVQTKKTTLAIFAEIGISFSTKKFFNFSKGISICKRQKIAIKKKIKMKFKRNHFSKENRNKTMAKARKKEKKRTQCK